MCAQVCYLKFSTPRSLKNISGRKTVLGSDIPKFWLRCVGCFVDYFKCSQIQAHEFVTSACNLIGKHKVL
jgi:hypothetical protein